MAVFLCSDMIAFLHSDTTDNKLKSVLEEHFGKVTYQCRKIVADELESVQKEHKNLLLAWYPTVETVLSLGFVHRSILPVEWFALVEFLKQNNVSNFTQDGVDLQLEETILNDQDSDGESVNNEEDHSANPNNNRLPDEDNGEPN